jgi:zinc protease
VSRFTRNFNGNCRPADFELMLQLTWLYFTKPAFRADAFERMVNEEVQSLKNQLNSPGGVYNRTIGEVASDGHWLFQTPSIGQIRALRPEDVERSYREMFNDGSEWTFVMVGNIDPAIHLPLVERWLGSIPTKSETPRTTSPDQRYAKLGLHFPNGRSSTEVRKGIEDQSRTMLMINAPYRLDQQAAFDIDAVSDLLGIRLREKLREEKGETYGASVGFTSFSPYRDYGRINISFTGSPDTRASMVADVKDAIRWMKMTVPSEADVTKLREMRLNDLAVAQKENGYWLRGVASALLQGRDPKSMLDGRRRIEKLDARAILASAKRWLDVNSLNEVYLVPETWQPPAKGMAPKIEVAPTVAAPPGG